MFCPVTVGQYMPTRNTLAAFFVLLTVFYPFHVCGVGVLFNGRHWLPRSYIVLKQHTARVRFAHLSSQFLLRAESVDQWLLLSVRYCIQPVVSVPEMTYNMSIGMLSLYSLIQFQHYWIICVIRASGYAYEASDRLRLHFSSLLYTVLPEIALDPPSTDKGVLIGLIN